MAQSAPAASGSSEAGGNCARQAAADPRSETAKLVRAGLAERTGLALTFESGLRLGTRPVAGVVLLIPPVLAMFPNLPAAAGV